MPDVRERLFVAYYLGEAEGDPVKAANLAGYSRAKLRGPAILRRKTVQEAIAERLIEADIGVKEVLMRLAQRARGNASSFLRFAKDREVNAPYVDFRKAKELDALGSIKKLKSTRIQKDDGPPLQVVEVELFDPLPALLLLAKYHGMVDRASNAIPAGSEESRPPERLTIPGFDARSIPQDES